MAEAMRRLSIALAWLAVAGAASAQDAGMNDPTRPPAALNAPVATGIVRPIADQPVVQSILVSQRPGGRRLAVIDGKTLRQGERLGTAIVESIRPTEVVLRRGNKRVTLKLFRPLDSVAAVQPKEE
jgi:MSHA biogenesis protein MshK